MTDPTRAIAYAPQAGVVQLVAAAGTNIPGTPGVLVSAAVTAVGTTDLTLYDNSAATASGTKLGVIPSTATVGVPLLILMPFKGGIAASGATTAPACTLSISD